jgi:hypothetical protein
MCMRRRNQSEYSGSIELYWVVLLICIKHGNITSVSLSSASFEHVLHESNTFHLARLVVIFTKDLIIQGYKVPESFSPGQFIVYSSVDGLKSAFYKGAGRHFLKSRFKARHSATYAANRPGPVPMIATTSAINPWTLLVSLSSAGGRVGR